MNEPAWMLACKYGHLSVLKFMKGMYKLDFDFNVHTKENLNCLTMCIQNDFLNCAEYILNEKLSEVEETTDTNGI